MGILERWGMGRKKAGFKPAEDIDRLMIDKELRAFESRPDMQELLDFRREILRIGIHGVRAADLENEDMSAWEEFKKQGWINKENYNKLISTIKPGPGYVSRVNFSQFLKRKTLEFIAKTKAETNTPSKSKEVDAGDIELKQ